MNIPREQSKTSDFNSMTFLLTAWATFATCAIAEQPSNAQKIGIIDTYGLHKITETAVLEASGLKVGEAVPASRKEVVQKLEASPGVMRATVQVVTAASPTSPGGSVVILYLGIDEGNQPIAINSPAPASDVELPIEIVETYDDYEQAVQDVIKRRPGNWPDIYRQGTSLVKDATVRAIQEKLFPLADQNFDNLADVLKNAKKTRHREIAAKVIAYTKDKQAAALELSAASGDPEFTVRNNAMASLSDVLYDIRQQPGMAITIPASRFVNMLESLDWTDRNKGMAVLLQLTETRNEAVLAELKEQALTNLAAMARWKFDGHASMAFMLLGRVMHLTDKDLFQAMGEGAAAREVLVVRALNSVAEQK